MLLSVHSGILGNETADVFARIGALSVDDLVVGRDNQFAISTTSSMDWSEGKNRGVEETS